MGELLLGGVIIIHYTSKLVATL